MLEDSSIDHSLKILEKMIEVLIFQHPWKLIHDDAFACAFLFCFLRYYLYAFEMSGMDLIFCPSFYVLWQPTDPKAKYPPLNRLIFHLLYGDILFFVFGAVKVVKKGMNSLEDQLGKKVVFLQSCPLLEKHCFFFECPKRKSLSRNLDQLKGSNAEF